MKDEKGFIYIIVIFVIMIVFMFSVIFIGWSVFNTRTSNRLSYSTRAFYLADAGIERAIFYLRSDNDEDWSNDNANPLFNESGYLVKTYNGSKSFIKVESVGTFNGVQRKIYSEITNFDAVFTSTLFSGSYISIEGNADVNGSAVASDTIYISGSSTVETVVQHANVPLPLLTDPDYYITEAIANKMNGNAGAEGNYFHGGTPVFTSLNGVIFIDKNPDGSPANIDISSNISTDAAWADSTFLIVYGNLKITGNVNFKGLLYVTGDLQIVGNVDTKGPLIAASISKVSGSTELHSSSNPAYENPYGFQSGVMAIKWLEIAP